MEHYMEKPVIYQMMTRLFANRCENPVKNGTYEQNGAGKMNDITPRVLSSIKELGVTHVWYTGIIEHATATDRSSMGIIPDNPHVVKGKAGSPYAIKDYYDVDPDLAVDVANRMTEFEDLVKRTHDAGMKVIIDFVPNHTARRYHSDVSPEGVRDFGADDDKTLYFGHNNNYYYIPRQLFAPVDVDLGSGQDAYVEFPAKATGNDCFTAFPTKNDWYETVKLNYGIDYGDGTRHFEPIPDTWKKMLDILRFWCSKGIDAFRCDMAFMCPIEFWKWVIPNVKEHYPYVKFIAEIYDVAQYRDFIFVAGFDYLYDKVNLYDTLRAVETGNTSAAAITGCWQTVEGIERYMLNFLENHDEQRFASRFYAGDATHALPSLVVSSMIGPGATMIYFGQELGERGEDEEGFSGLDGRTTIFDYWSLSTVRRWLNDGLVDGALMTEAEKELRENYKRVLSLCNSERAIVAGRLFDLMYVNYDSPGFDPHRLYAFLRSYAGETVLVVANFGPNQIDAAVNIPRHAFDILAIPEGTYTGVELLSQSEPHNCQFTSTQPFEVSVKPYGAVIWKLTR